MQKITDISLLELKNLEDWIQELVKFHYSLVPFDLPRRGLIGYFSPQEECAFLIKLDSVKAVDHKKWYSEAIQWLSERGRDNFIPELRHAYSIN